MGKKNLKQQIDSCTTRRQFVQVAKKNGGTVWEGKNHTNVENKGIRTQLPRHDGDLHRGLTFHIRKQFWLLFGILVLAAWVGFSFSQVAAQMVEAGM
jgi:hypothetical protein